jgi:heptosyltransferase-3
VVHLRVLRFTDQSLRSAPHIAVIGSDKVGNFVVATPLLRGLKEKYPGCVVDFYGGDTTADLESVSRSIDSRFSLYTNRPGFLGALADHVRARAHAHGPVDLCVNCDGFSPVAQVAATLLEPQFAAGAVLRSDRRADLPFESDDPRARLLSDPDWNRDHLELDYPDLLSSGYLAEILCRMAYVDTDFTKVELGSEPPPFEVPDVLVHMTTTRPAKMWPASHWRRLLDWCDSNKISTGLVGSKPEIERELYGGGAEEELLAQTGLRDLRGRTKLTELAGAFQRAKAAVVVDAGPMHLAVGVGCPTLCLFGNDAAGNGASPVRLWAPRAGNVLRVASRSSCTLCMENRFRNTGCLVEGHPCMSGLDPDDVITGLSKLLGV